MRSVAELQVPGPGMYDHQRTKTMRPNRRRGTSMCPPPPDPSNPWKKLKSLFNPQIWVFPKIRVPQNGWFIMENPIKLDDLGVPLFSETSIWVK